MNTTLTTEAVSWQQELPNGLLLRNELVGSQAWEAIDERYGVERPVARLIRFFPIAPEWKQDVLLRLQQLATSRMSHVETPLEAGWIAGQSVLYLVERPYHSLLETRLSEKGLPIDEAQTIFDTLAAGIGELHAQRLIHGDLRPGNIFLRNAGSIPDACLGNVATGPLPFWSGGTVVVDDVQRYLPPEANGAVPKPSATVDLYALGVIGCELFLGHKALQTLGGKSAELSQLLKERRVSRATRRTLTKLLDTRPGKRPQQIADVRRILQGGVPVWVERSVLAAVIVLLLVLTIRWGQSSRVLRTDLTDAEARVTKLDQETADVRLRLEQSELLRLSEEDRLRHELSGLRDQSDQYRTELNSNATDISSIRAVLAERALSHEQLMARIGQIVGQPPATDQQLWSEFQTAKSMAQAADQTTLDNWLSSHTPPIAASDAERLSAWEQQLSDIVVAQASVGLLDESQQQPWSERARDRQAQAIWQHWNRGPGNMAARIEALRNTRSNLPRNHPVDQRLTEWQRQLAELATAAGSWLIAKTEDTVAADLSDKVQEAIQTPWNVEKWETAVTFCRAATQAAAIWHEYAVKDDLPWDAFGSRLANKAEAESKPPSAVVGQLLKRWQSAFERRSGGLWKLQLVKGTVAPPKGQTAVPDYGKYRMFNLYSADEHVEVKHVWSSISAHTYAKSKQEFVEFSWTVGDPIELLLEQDGWAANDNLVGETFSGPVSLWRLHIQRRVSNPETGVSMDFRVVDCPGPPKEVVEGFKSIANRMSAP